LTPFPEQEETPPGFENNTQGKPDDKGKSKNTEKPSEYIEGSHTKKIRNG
jgi:hypothetical protein